MLIHVITKINKDKYKKWCLINDMAHGDFTAQRNIFKSSGFNINGNPFYHPSNIHACNFLDATGVCY